MIPCLYAHPDIGYQSVTCKRRDCNECSGIAIGPDGPTDCDCCCHDIEKAEAHAANLDSMFS